MRSFVAVTKKGTRIQLGEGVGPTVTLANDAASQYICETDAIKTLIYKDGKWKNFYDQKRPVIIHRLYDPYCHSPCNVNDAQ